MASSSASTATTGPVHVQGSVYYSHFSNFIFQAPTGEIEDGLPVYEYREGKADYYGFEVESDAEVRQSAWASTGAASWPPMRCARRSATSALRR